MDAPSARDVGTDLHAELPSPRLRAHLRRSAEILDRIHEASGRGDIATTLHEASLLARHRDQAHHAPPPPRDEAPVAPVPTVLVRLNSHRAADRLERLLNAPLNWHYTWRDGGTFAVIPSDRLTDARKIPGVTLARPNGAVHSCATAMGAW